MRFACQSCGKAYNLPEEKIADKSNVKLKCRVCGAIVEVKKQGEVVASILGEGENKRGRVSEAPAPLTSMMPDDSDDATHAIAVSDHILSEGGSDEDAASALMGHVQSALGQRGLGALPPPAPTGFGSPPAAGFGAATAAGFAPSASGFGAPSGPGFGAPSGPGYAPSPAGFGQGAPPGFAPTPVPPPLSVPDLPPFGRPDASAAPSLPSALAGSSPGSPPPPLPNAELSHSAGSHGMGSLQNGSNGASRFGDGVQSDDPLPAGMAPVAMSAAGAGGAVAMSPLASGDMGSYSGPAPVDMQAPVQGSDTTRKMLAALATGILIGFIIARLFF
jgi:hypothetical protein